MNEITGILQTVKSRVMSSRAWVTGVGDVGALTTLEGWPLAAALVGINGLYVISETVVKVHNARGG